MEELEEEFIVSKEEFKKYFNENKYVDKKEIMLYYTNNKIKNINFISRLFPDLVLNNQK